MRSISISPFSSPQSTLRRCCALIVMALWLCANAFASPRSEAWKLRRSDPKNALSQLQQVVRNDPRDAKAYWFMAMIFNDLGRGQEGLQALQSAKSADPASSFTDSPDSVSKLEAALSRKSGGAGSGSSSGASRTGSDGGQSTLRPDRGVARGGNGAGGSSLDQNEIVKALESSSVWVSPNMQNVADPTAIQNAIRGANRPVKVVVMDRLPGGSGNIGQFALKLHGYLNLDRDDGLVIVVTGAPRNVAAYGGGYIKNDALAITKIVSGASKTFTTQGYPAGIAQIVQEFDAAEKSEQRSGTIGLLTIIGVPTAGIIWWRRRKKANNAVQLEQLRQQTRDLSSKLAPQYEKLDSDYEYAVLGETDPNRKKQLQEMHARAGEAFSGAMKQLNVASDLAAYSGAQRALNAAAQEMQRARNVLEGNPADAGVSRTANQNNGQGQSQTAGAADDAYEIPPLGTDEPGARAGYALDFFTSEPVPRDSMVPVEIEIGGQRRRVWASPQSAQRALNGQPQVATINANGRQMPWYNAPQSYNPWNDWGSTMLNMMAVNMMMDSIFRPHYGYGYGGFGGGFGYGGGYGGTTIINNYDNDNGNWNSNRDDSSYNSADNRIDNTSPDYGGAGVSSLDSPFAGGGNDPVSSGYDGGSSSLDIFGSGSSSSSDSS